MPAITPFLWFNDKAEEAAALYVPIIPNRLSPFNARGINRLR
jgi:predicted 3-demethylubiquinone-9 3-methyltransferase (glyoxalase superfamily)